MRLIHFVRKFSPLSETFVYDLVVSAASCEGIESRLVAYRRFLQDERPFEPVVLVPRLDKPTELLIKIRKKFHLPGQKDRRVERIRRAQHLFDDCDLIHAHFGVSAYDLLKGIDDPSLPGKLVVSLHGTDTAQYLAQKKEYRKVLVQAAEQGCRFIANSRYLADKAVSAGLPAASIRILYNTVAPEFTAAARSFPHPGSGPLKLVSVGRLVEWKGHEYLIRALPSLLERFDEVELFLVGDGPRAEALSVLAAELGVGKSVRMLGAVSHEAIPGIMAACHVYVQPSFTHPKTGQEESFGVALLEAIAVGLPVVLTDSGGMPEVVGFESGSCARIVPQRNAQAIADGISDVIGDSRSFALESPYRLRVLDKYSRDSRIQMLLSIYRETRQKD
jgi:glycosyltransferase involved in cell wall biosynthesis